MTKLSADSKTFLKQNWLSILSLWVGVLGIALGYYFYTISKQTREPVFSMSSASEIFAGLPDGGASNFEVVNRETGQAVRTKLFVQKFLFWNEGNLSIKKDNILRPLRIVYPQSVEVVDVSITEATRSTVISPIITVQEAKNVAGIEFFILDGGDGFRFQIIYASDRAESPNLLGDIESVSFIPDISAISSGDILFGALKAFIGLGLLFGLLFALLIGVPSLIGAGLSKIVPERARARVNRFYEGYAALIITVGMLVFILYSGGKMFAEYDAEGDVPEMRVYVPDPPMQADPPAADP